MKASEYLITVINNVTNITMPVSSGVALINLLNGLKNQALAEEKAEAVKDKK